MEITRIRMSFSILQMLGDNGITKEDVFKNTLAIAMLAAEFRSTVPNVSFYENNGNFYKELIISFSTVGIDPTFVALLKDRINKQCDGSDVRLDSQCYRMKLNPSYIDALRMSLSEIQPNGVK